MSLSTRSATEFLGTYWLSSAFWERSFSPPLSLDLQSDSSAIDSVRIIRGCNVVAMQFHRKLVPNIQLNRVKG